jgi:hypothetical protein
MDGSFFEQFVGKKILIQQKDGFIKNGLCRGYDEQFIFIEFEDGTPVSISKDFIEHLRVIE